MDADTPRLGRYDGREENWTQEFDRVITEISDLGNTLMNMALWESEYWMILLPRLHPELYKSQNQASLKFLWTRNAGGPVFPPATWPVIAV